MKHVIVFNNVSGSNAHLPHNLAFTVRPHTGDIQWRTDLTYPIYQTGSPVNDSSCKYLQETHNYVDILMCLHMTCQTEWETESDKEAGSYMHVQISYTRCLSAVQIMKILWAFYDMIKSWRI